MYTCICVALISVRIPTFSLGEPGIRSVGIQMLQHFLNELVESLKCLLPLIARTFAIALSATKHYAVLE